MTLIGIVQWLKVISLLDSLKTDEGRKILGEWISR
jgi:hypothetical protein